MKQSILFLIAFISFGQFVQAQNIRLEGEKLVEDEQFNKSQSILPIYKYQGLSIEPYTRFGVESDKDLEWHRIKRLPNMSACRDTAYTYVYFSGADNQRSQGYLLTMVGNYFRSKRTVYFWIDRNNDLDFTNDGPPDSLPFAEQDLTLYLNNLQDSTARYAVKLSRFKYGENVRYKRLLNEHYRTHSGTKEFTSVNFCYREQRYNSAQFSYRSAQDSFSFGLKDMNVDGFYNEREVDMFYVGPLESQISLSELRELSKKDKENRFEWAGKQYEIAYIAPNADYVELKVVNDPKLVNSLPLGKSTPDFSYFNITNNEHSLSEYKQHEVYLYFWNNERLSAEDTTYLSKIHREFNDQIKLISLNHGDIPRKVRMTFFYDRLSFPVGYSNVEIAELYKLEDVPRGFYLGKKCKLKDDRISPREMYERLVAEYKPTLSNQ